MITAPPGLGYAGVVVGGLAAYNLIPAGYLSGRQPRFSQAYQ
jgi:hypothetical protein